MRVGIILAVLLCLWGTAAVPVLAQGTPLIVEPNQPYRQELRLEPGHSYRIALNLRSSVPNAIVYLTVELFASSGEQIGLSQVQRGLGDPNRWYNIGIEFTAPEQIAAAELSISVDSTGDYWWDCSGLPSWIPALRESVSTGSRGSQLMARFILDW